MELEGSKLSGEVLKGAPMLMPWRKFAAFIGMSEGVVEGWIRVGHIPRVKIGNRVMVNVTLLNQRLLQGEGI
ncbi:DNA-binding protein [Pseudomonas nicosulfuronedens]|uniref:DNA-binding protein n=1 Tax=Pseudomonas nicosulfuronedens TaxID=2571105 RepID=UPI00244A83E1|nr:DNA-binding protein [Pseudomonas nicosulfuronedens]MDH1008318.1 DNA-binding protein [Pseudomonas nicosulfuronedens]MDH1979276.1 DNA-binding protein [Pseudomonas nicosulfuronedens]MDH2027276.1 DNA-binding protein [Pseudomonas nicosulfuronedens]